jgi:signal transduction histidine kinase
MFGGLISISFCHRLQRLNLVRFSGLVLLSRRRWWILLASEFLLGSAVENILRNAVDYTRPQMTADVSIAESAEAATIVFRDCGPDVSQRVGVRTGT